MAEIDIKIDDPFKDGDFKLDDADYQNVQAIIITQKGQFYQWPTLGVNITSLLNAPAEVAFLQSTITDELLKDNYILTEYESRFENSRVEIQIDAQRLR